MELISEIEKLKRELTSSIKLLKENGVELAKAERDYKMKVCTEVLRLRDEKMAVTMISSVIYGIPSVADLRFKRDVAEVTYNANQEHINVTKLKLRLLESQLSREWGDVN